MDLNQITIYTRKSAEMADFYLWLGLRLIVDSLPRYARFECPDGETTLSIHAADEEYRSGIVIYFECDDLDSKVSELKAHGAVFEQDPIDQSWLWREAYLRDPDGNRICLYHAGENRKNPRWRLR
jgi:catechol 2,3-dioxygenase-like lactoylglutathione lyase family enzyme